MYRDQAQWTRMSIMSTAGSGFFSSDRTIAEVRPQCRLLPAGRRCRLGCRGLGGGAPGVWLAATCAHAWGSVPAGFCVGQAWTLPDPHLVSHQPLPHPSTHITLSPAHPPPSAAAPQYNNDIWKSEACVVPTSNE